MTKLCADGQCPAVYRTERGTLLVQGDTIGGQQAGIDLPAHESLVEIPIDLLLAAVRDIG